MTVVRAPWSVVSLYNIVTPWMSELVQQLGFISKIVGINILLVVIIRKPGQGSLLNFPTTFRKKVRILGEDFQSAPGHCSAPVFTALGVSLGNLYSLYMS